MNVPLFSWLNERIFGLGVIEQIESSIGIKPLGIAGRISEYRRKGRKARSDEYHRHGPSSLAENMECNVETIQVRRGRILQLVDGDQEPRIDCPSREAKFFQEFAQVSFEVTAVCHAGFRTDIEPEAVGSGGIDLELE